MSLSFIVPDPKTSSKIVQIMSIKSTVQKVWQTACQLSCLKYNWINNIKEVYFGSLQFCLGLYFKIHRIITVTLGRLRVLYFKYQ